MVKTKAKYKQHGHIVLPRQPLPFWFLHLFLKKEELYEGTHNFFAFFAKTVANKSDSSVTKRMRDQLSKLPFF